MSRQVHGVVDGDGLYFARAAAGGPYVFLASTAVDESGKFAADARVAPPYHLSPSAQVRSQTSYIFDRYKEALSSFGTTVNDIVQVEQYIEHKVHADGYLEASRGPGNMERGRPGSALIATGEIGPGGCVVNPTGIAVIPQEGYEKRISGSGEQDPGQRPELGEAYAEEPVYNEIVTAGPYVFTVGDWSSDYESGIHKDARAPDWIWWGNEARAETEFIMKALKARLESAGSSMEHTVHSTFFLVDPADQYEVDMVLRKYITGPPPARSVISVRGLGTPRKEGVYTQAENAMKLESMFQSIKADGSIDREVVSTGAEQFGFQSEAIKAGPLLWTSGVLAGDSSGLLAGSDTASQVAHIFDRLRDVCEAGGTSIDKLLRVRAYLLDESDERAVYDGLRAAVPSDPPCVAVTTVPGPLQVPDCTVMIDAVAYVD
jgi:enamine deaminase RidA (YjgF/YER057c/UK114 family)